MEEERISWNYIIFTALIGIFLLLNLFGIFRTLFGVNTAIFLTLIGGYKIFYHAVSELFEKRISVDLAIGIAAIGALAIRQYLAAAEVIFIMLIGEALEMYAVDKTRSAIKNLVALAPKRARVRRDGIELELPLEAIRVGETVICKPGERIPVDGVVIHGSSFVDQGPISGESIPVEKQVGSEVYSGTINQHGIMEIRSEKVGEDTLLARIIHLVEDAQEKKAPFQKTADRYAVYFVPTILILAALTLLFSRDWIRAVSVLIIACPCALVLATPTAVVAGIGRLAKEGILVKGGMYLEAVGRIDTLVLDKTGTVTQGRPRIIDIKPQGGYDRKGVLALAASAESCSEHLLARLIVEKAKEEGIEVKRADTAQVIPGRGVVVGLGRNKVVVGNRKMVEEHGITLSVDQIEELERIDASGQTPILVADNRKLAGIVSIEDSVRPDAEEAIGSLTGLGVKNIHMLTGDTPRVAHVIAERVGIREVQAGLLPDQKAEHIRRLQSEGRKVGMVGDGINDAPSLAMADVGIAMGGIGTDIAIEAADVILMADDLGKLRETVLIGKRTIRVIKQNILFFAVVFNLLAVVAASFFTFITPVWAAVIHQISSLLVVGNSLRLLASHRIRQEMRENVVSFLRYLSREVWGKGGDWIGEHSTGLLRSVVILGVLIYVWSGLFIVSPNQLGVVQIFGKRRARTVSPGLHYIPPWPIGRVTKLPRSVDRVEIGFRSRSVREAQADPNRIFQPLVAYEWDIQHRTGAYKDNPDESQTFTGDENFIELDMVVHYIIRDPALYLFRIRGREDADSIIRFTSKSTIIRIIAKKGIDNILTTERNAIEKEAMEGLQTVLDDYGAGIEVKGIYLQSVHPPIEVADAFRDVVNANEEKNRLINLAEAYSREQLPLARGNAFTSMEDARAYRKELVDKSIGDGKRFLSSAGEFERYPSVTKERLYLETMESGLAGVKKFVLDKNRTGGSELTIVSPKEFTEFLNTLSTGLRNNTGTAPRGGGMGGGNQ
ncbi:MAG: FtsH protease activity modulator HflK [bacterium]